MVYYQSLVSSYETNTFGYLFLIKTYITNEAQNLFVYATVFLC
jgi:hypothetical protein